MVTFDCSASHHDGVTLVTVHLRDIAEPTRVTVRNCLDGPVWPPRSEGLPEAGWTASGFSGVLTPGSHALGYATPARPEAPPAELADVTAAPETDTGETRSTSPADVVRELGDPSPPADAVPAAQLSPPADAVPAAESSPEPTAPGEDGDTQPTAERAESPTTAATPVADEDGAPGDRSPDSDAEGDHTAGLPPELGPWLAEMERRTDTAEALAVAETLPEATRAVNEAGGLDGVRALADAGDEAQLRRLARRARRLADRRARATIPVETLAALA
ncbi:hypothetical protein [Haloarcula salinisoli]|uniref:DUF8080 domain-containing protein n=1 Tax=Haloarcula salinisoli TaxID=2487746 RepID=A0A8J8C9F8_9EURY|nr:hypothetical protein [Halomicroarcula salinisoli]MBX0304169.1 hypothetical protein [Halomicroarcula salinisoli]